MVDNIQLPRDLLAAKTSVDTDVLRSVLLDMIVRMNSLEARIEELENGN